MIPICSSKLESASSPQVTGKGQPRPIPCSQTSFGLRGQRDAAYEHLDRALALVEKLPSSRAKAVALARRCRFHSVAGEWEEAIRLAPEVLAMAGELGLDEVRANLLVTLGTARVEIGDGGGIDDMERGLAIAVEISIPEATQRAYGGLSNLRWSLGQLGEATETIAAMRRSSERFGLPGLQRWVVGVEVIDSYLNGEWLEAERIADSFVSESERGPAHYLDAPCYYIRAYARLSRDDLSGADADTARALELAWEAKDPQVTGPTLAARAAVLVALERADEARSLIDELLEVFARGLAHWSVDAAWSCFDLGRGNDFVSELERFRIRSPWLEAARAIAAADMEQAAEVLGAMGAMGHEAYARLRAAEQLVTEGRRPEAGEQLQRAVAFFREVGATRYVRQAEALLAASA